MSVVCLDDQYQFLSLMRKMLHKIGFEEVFESQNWDDCFTQIENMMDENQSLQIIFIDGSIKSTGDGIRYGKIIKHFYPKVPLILVSGYPKEYFEDDLYIFDGFLQKPFEFNDLKEVCKPCLK